MSPREKNLLIILGLALFIILNFVAYSSFYSPMIKKAAGEKRIAEDKLRLSEMTLTQGEDLDPEIQWLEARAKKIELRDSRILPFQPGQHFTRVRVLCKVVGAERDVFSWLATIHRTNQRQVITKMELSPMKTDLTKVECEVEVEKWIIVAEDV